jgi:hypothetical protein
VQDAVAREEERLRSEHGFTAGLEARKRMLDDWTVSYYFRDLDGVEVAFRPHARGVEVLGVGFEEVLLARQTYGDGEGCGITYRQV